MANTEKEARSITLKLKTIEMLTGLKVFNEDYPFSYMVDEVVSSYTYQYLRTKIELAGYFIESEANLIIDATNGLIQVDSISAKILLSSSVKDGAELFDMDTSHGADASVLLHKISNLTEFQCHTVLQMVKEYWKAPEGETIAIKELFKCKEEL